MINKAIVYTHSNKLFVHHMTFGDWLREQIKKAGLSNAEVARRTGLSPTYIGNLVRDHSPNTKKGKGRPSEFTVEKIAKAVNGNLNTALTAAGFVPKNEALISHEIFQGITVTFQNVQLPKIAQEDILKAMRLIARGAIEEHKEETNEKEESQVKREIIDGDETVIIENSEDLVRFRKEILDQEKGKKKK